MDKEKMITCPYNSAHRVRTFKLPIHLAKCKKNYSDQIIVICPFNATHQLKGVDLKDHLEECKDKCIADRDIYNWHEVDRNASEAIFNYTNDSQSSTEYPQDDGEDWDAEESFAYKQEENVLFKNVARIPPSGLAAAKRKKWRVAETERLRLISQGLDIKDIVFPTAEGGEYSLGEIITSEQKVEKPYGFAGPGLSESEKQYAQINNCTAPFRKVGLPDTGRVAPDNRLISNKTGSQGAKPKTRIAANIYSGLKSEEDYGMKPSSKKKFIAPTSTKQMMNEMNNLSLEAKADDRYLWHEASSRKSKGSALPIGRGLGRGMKSPSNNLPDVGRTARGTSLRGRGLPRSYASGFSDDDQ